MLNASIRRKTLLVLLAAVLVTSWPAAAGPIFESPRSGRVMADLHLLDRFWSLFRGAWTKAGCNIDPFGRLCPVQSPPPESEIGCGIDPDGHLRCTP